MSTEPQPSTQTPAPAPASDPQLDTPPPQTAQTQPPTQQVPLPQHKIRPTRTSGLWVAVGFFAVILLLLLIFILQNGKQGRASPTSARTAICPLGVALLLAAVCGVLLVVLAGAARISQLRTVARRHRRADAQRATAAASQHPSQPAAS